MQYKTFLDNMLAQVNIDQSFGSRFGSFGVNNLTLADLVSSIISLSFALSGLIVLFMFIFAGYALISSAGNNDPQQAAKGKQAATWAIVGFLTIFAAYWVIKLIEVAFGGITLIKI